MKFIFSILILTLSVSSISAQTISAKEYEKHLKKIKQSRLNNTVILSLDTVYDAGSEYAILRKTNPSGNDYSVRNLMGKELMYFRFNSFNEAEYSGNIGSQEKKYYYEIIFSASQKKCEVPSMNAAQIAAFIVDKRLIADGQIQKDAEAHCIETFGKKYSGEKNKPVQEFSSEIATSSYELVKRDKAKEIFIVNTSILQDDQTIGTIISETSQDNIITFIRYTISLPDGTMIAKAKTQSYGDENIQITTLQDAKTIKIPKPSYWVDKTILQFLVEKGYL